MRKKNKTVFWLIPGKPELELFRAIIGILATQLGAPLFEPHLTLFGASAKERQPQKMLRVFKCEPVSLKVHEVAFEGKFTKTLFVRFESNAGLKKLVVDLARVSKSQPKLPIDPHLSLLYKKLPPTAKRDLAGTIKLPFRKVTFDSIAVMSCASPTTTPAEVKKWRRVATRSLS